MPAFALDLDPDGIRLLHREAERWREIDRVSLDDPALPKRLRAMRATAEAMAEGPLETALIIPPSQILYTRVPAPADDGAIGPGDVAQALDGLTACPVGEMVFDWRREGGTLRVAALDVNTLDEAETFAATYGFNPVRFAAHPDPEDFPDDPDFGPTQWASAVPAAPAVPVFSTSRRDAPAPATVAAPPDDRMPEALPAPAAPAVAKPTAPPATAVGQAPPARVPAPRQHRRRRADMPRPERGPVLRRGPIAVATAVILCLGGLTWTALYLVTPKPRPGLPELAATPAAPVAEGAIAGLVPAPRQGTPEIAGDMALPPLPDTGGPESGIREAMAARRSETLPAGSAPDPGTEVGVLSSADIWQSAPPPIVEPASDTSDDLYLAAVDPEVALGDAFALTEPTTDQAALEAPPSPPEPGTVFALDDRGLVVATPDGALTPDGVTVTAGAPPLRPPLRPTTAVLAPDPGVALALAGKTPRPRPGDLTERMERANNGGRTLEELADLTPRPRPVSEQQEAVAEVDGPPSALAVAVSRAPSYRPNDFAAIVAAAQQARAASPENDTAVIAASAAAVAPVKPTIPSSASVARQATIEGALNLRRLNLIGVYGAASDRRALLRLPSGRYVKVKVGDRIDGGQIAAIGNNELRYVKGGKNHTLKVPSS